MVKQNSSSFIHELRIRTTPHDLKVLDIRLDVARQIYNACLGEGFKRLKLVRQSKIYQKACNLPKKVKNATGESLSNKARNKLFQKANEENGFFEYALHSYATELRKKDTWLNQHIDSAMAQKLATRAYKAIFEYVIGNRGRPRFKGKNQLNSIESKSNNTGIRYRNNKILWNGLELIPCFDLKDKHNLESYALSCKTKYVRLVKRVIKGNIIWYAQLVQEGMAFVKAKSQAKNAVVGLDIGPSTIAYVGNNCATLTSFCDEVLNYDKKIKVNQRKIARSMRAMNPKNYEPNSYSLNCNGRKIKKLGKNKTKVSWVQSNRCKQLYMENQELSRKMAASRNTSQGTLANEILQLGNIIKTEKLSYKSFQKNYGKSISKRAPSKFIEKIRYKAANAGGALYEFSTYKTALSQTCICGHRLKKRLNQRWHDCPTCKTQAQRDLFSAYLARFVEKDHLDITQAQNTWAGFDTILKQAVSKLENQLANRQHTRLSSFGLNQRQSHMSVKEESATIDALDDVCVSRELERASSFVLRTHRL